MKEDLSDKESRKRLKEKLESFSNSIPEYSPQSSFTEDFGDIGTLEDINYDQEIEEAKNESENLMGSLADLYLGKSNLSEHPYFKERIKKDAKDMAKYQFMTESLQKMMMELMKQIEQGSNRPAMFLAFGSIVKEMRENMKLSSTQMATIENFYKVMRGDLEESKALEESKVVNELSESPISNNPDEMIYSPKDFNEMIKNANEGIKKKEAELNSKRLSDGFVPFGERGKEASIEVEIDEDDWDED